MLHCCGDASGFIARRDNHAEQFKRRLFAHRIFNRECTRINTNFLFLLKSASISVHSWLVLVAASAHSVSARDHYGEESSSQCGLRWAWLAISSRMEGRSRFGRQLN